MELIVVAAPAKATLYLDGVPIDGNPIRAKLPRDLAPRRIRAAAPGHQDQEVFVVLDQDRTVKLTLAPLSPRTRTPAAGPVAPPATPASHDSAPPPEPRKARSIDEADPYSR